MQHCFEPRIAEKYGLLEAVLVEFFRGYAWDDDAIFVDGKRWRKISVRELCIEFPYATTKQMRKAINNLLRKGVLLTRDLNGNRLDRTKWYALEERRRWDG